MKKTFKAFWLALMGVMWLFLMATSCHKTPDPNPEPDLPPETQTGAGTIGCYINGKPWWPKPYVSIGIPQFLEVVFDESRDNFFGLNARKDASFSEHLNIYVVNASLGSNIMVSRNSDSFYNSKNKNNCELSYLDTTKTRILVITKLDKINRIISGFFEFTAVNNCKDTLRFTQGRFDSKF
jgi:hypothetical protein